MLTKAEKAKAVLSVLEEGICPRCRRQTTRMMYIVDQREACLACENGSSPPTKDSSMLTKTEKAAAVVRALSDLQVGDEVQIFAHDFQGGASGYVAEFSPFTGSIRVEFGDNYPLWFKRHELHLV